jgi:muconolactone delta-isomerase
MALIMLAVAVVWEMDFGVVEVLEAEELRVSQELQEQPTRVVVVVQVAALRALVVLA